MSKSVLIVDDHPVVCEAIRKTLETQGYTIVGETADGISALNMILSLRPDIVILDVSLEKMDGLTVLKRIAQANLDVRVLVFTAQSVDTYAMRCLQAGASGFVSKNEPLTKLLKAVDTIVEGYVFFPKKSMPFSDGGRGKHSSDVLAALTNRELEVLKLLAEGLTNLEIAEKLHLSNKTVSGHKINILSKLGVTSVVDLVNIARQNELV
ncbi:MULTISPECIES: response regulator transcription factor [Pseudomonas]|jgi:two-component system response regulator EvgA|uniref:Response regulator transcription factor n=2 Tax=Pseudomonas TaxID=286 RepID=A0AAU7X3Z9_9PSED|nr:MULTISPECIES: response regulator transcription factor [Pseudomonas]GED73820.1 DNA-binding response regulator [Pseudomonas fluorescens]AGL84771.1 virulence factors putative positive transcription regulator BvgA [Pseudomonas protegens CHA0]APC21248.1 DNA-binding response regulator [Pseudomonas protegens]AQT09834.1 LuxR family transcriptional regulator [Pseudomonas protegens]MBP5110752.1 response regulator transcription factor [Pseudomonas protegens]